MNSGLKRNLNDRVEEIHRALVEDENYLRLLYAVHDKQAIEGSLAVDNMMAARMIRDKAKGAGDLDVAHEKLTTIVKALNVVLRRYNISRKQRRAEEAAQ